MICNTCKFKEGCVLKPINDNCGYHKRTVALPINQHPLKDEITDKIRSGEIVFS